MLASNARDSYDIWARIYNERKGPNTTKLAIPPVEKLLLPFLPQGAHILDLGCGTGQLAQYLKSKGYQVTGIDLSEGMLNYARENAPDVEFILTDARFFDLPCTFDGVISTSDGLNHLMSLEDLTHVFQNVYTSLLENGLFVFDLNLEERYETDWWNGSVEGDLKDDYAWAARRSYDREEKISQTSITVFNLVDDGSWRRTDTNLLGRCYSRSEILSALKGVGFTEVKEYDAKRDFDIHEWGPGKAYFVCHKKLGK